MCAFSFIITKYKKNVKKKKIIKNSKKKKKMFKQKIHDIWPYDTKDDRKKKKYIFAFYGFMIRLSISFGLGSRCILTQFLRLYNFFFFFFQTLSSSKFVIYGKRVHRVHKLYSQTKKSLLHLRFFNLIT